MQLLLGAYEVSNRAQNIPHPVQYLDCVPSRRNVQVRGIQAVLQAISMSLPLAVGGKSRCLAGQRNPGRASSHLHVPTPSRWPSKK
ncbi:hypothetical protein HYQ46_004291 [Verticillium longisporum]|nr:hypothetical protein HYQ46_004291 [Verticillium longisporum]